MTKPILFRDLSINDTFDFISGNNNSFHRRCMKISPRKYRTIERGMIQVFTIGAIAARVYHVNQEEQV